MKNNNKRDVFLFTTSRADSQQNHKSFQLGDNDTLTFLVRFNGNAWDSKASFDQGDSSVYLPVGLSSNSRTD